MRRGSAIDYWWYSGRSSVEVVELYTVGNNRVPSNLLFQIQKSKGMVCVKKIDQFESMTQLFVALIHDMLQMPILNLYIILRFMYTQQICHRCPLRLYNCLYGVLCFKRCYTVHVHSLFTTFRLLTGR